MAVRSRVHRTVWLVAAVLLSGSGPPASGSGEPQESFLYKNFVRASAILDRAMVAHGGAGLLDRTLDLRFSLTGTVRYEAHYARPWAHRDYRLEASTFYSADAHALKSEVTLYDEGQPRPGFIIVGPANGVRLDNGKTKPSPIPEAELEKSLREELEVLPHEYLRQARAGAAGLRLLAGPKGYDVLSYSLDDGEGRALFFDAKTHLLTRVERIGHWKHKGDRLEWRTFTGYVDRVGIKIPLRSEVHVEESSVQHNVISEMTGIELGAKVTADELAVPTAYQTEASGWTLEKPSVENPDALLPTHDLGNGAFIIELPPSTARSLLVAFSDFAVIVEAGDYSEISARLLATADQLLPDKPVRYVAMSHHHPLYANGLRPYVQRGVTVLTTAGNVSYLRDLATRPYRIHPDEQQRKPRDPRLEVIDGTRVIDDGTQRLELHELRNATHVDEFVVAYLPSHKLIVTGDFVYIVRDATPGPASVREIAIDRFVKERKLDVQSIMQTWYLAETDHVVPYSMLEEKIRLAQEKQ